ncbi:conserved hypothetical protein [Sulfolobus islandicus L.S.2.15]|uniref:Uncharacterized protein n=1 Tax=Saccharolobus islandicus (strain L.S.2.15 / Lassen \|nr:hypothetical protein [Sulfolobus islandicus]ACP34291.1 conserved hypothetical protein [Sulfolobus islandicus L.S.2.15]
MRYLGDIIFQLSINDKTQLSNHQIYLYLYQLVYSSEITTSVDKLPAPYYPYLIVTYHLLFVQKNKKRAKQLFDKIKEEYTKTRGIRFSYDEEKMYEVLNALFERIIVISYSLEVCEELRKVIDNIEINEYSWAYFFKQLILVQLGLNGIDSIEQKFEEYKNSLIFPVDIEVAEHFNIISDEAGISRIIDYLDKEFQRIKKEYKNLNNEIAKLEKEIQKLEYRYEKINNLIAWISKKGVIPIFSIISWTISKQISSKKNELSKKHEEICKWLFKDS